MKQGRRWAFAAVWAAGAAFAAGQAVPLERIAVIEIHVSDLAPARDYYCGMLGLPEIFDLHTEDTDSEFFRANDEQYLEFTTGGPGPMGLESVTFLTNDLKGARNLLHKEGIDAGRTAVGPDGNLRFALSDPMGKRIYVMHYVAGSQEMRRRTQTSSLCPTAKQPIARHLLHAGLAANDMAKSLQFYEKLGFREYARGGADPDRINWINLTMAIDRGDYIELLPNAKVSLAKREHISFEVPQEQATYDELVRRGITPLTRPYLAATHRWMMNTVDPYGMRIEYMGETTSAPVPGNTYVVFHESNGKTP